MTNTLNVHLDMVIQWQVDNYKSIREKQSSPKLICCLHSSTMREQNPQDDMSMETVSIPADLHGN